MDLFSLIIIIFAGFIIKYLTDTISSLTKEIKEIKIKCIKPSSTETFSHSSKYPLDKISSDMKKNISYMKKFFD
tara:strand:- start:14845 stop:15066 length:222 start_codon:yes stop_codon:yes gene_type:complete